MNAKFAVLLSLTLASSVAMTDADGETIPLGVDQDAAQVGQLPEDASFADVDADSDGLISEEEASEYDESLAENFHQADADADGYWTRSEYNNLLGQETLEE